MIRRLSEITADARRMTPADLIQVSDIERRSYDFPWSHGVFRDCLLAGYASFVLERDNEIVGYCILSVAAGEAHILNLCVDPGYRKLGYGNQLLDQALDYAQAEDVEQVFLEVRPSNAAAVALYRKKGFRQIAERPAYYRAHNGQGKEDAAVFAFMMKQRG